jgi:hypothetical protein
VFESNWKAVQRRWEKLLARASCAAQSRVPAAFPFGFYHFFGFRPKNLRRRWALLMGRPWKIIDLRYWLLVVATVCFIIMFVAAFLVLTWRYR